MGSALLNTADDLEFATSEENLAPAVVSGTADELRAQVAERLAAHRSRRGAGRAQAATEPVRPAAAGRSAQIAAAVAERYARTPSYREALAAEARRAIQQARAAAEVAALNAQAIAAAQQRLLEAYDEDANRREAEQREASQEADRLAAVLHSAPPDGFAVSSEELHADAARAPELWPDLALGGSGTVRVGRTRGEGTGRGLVPLGSTLNQTAPASAGANSGSTGVATTGTAARPTGLTVRLYEDDAVRGGSLSASAALPAGERPRQGREYWEHRGQREERSDAEAMALDDEIAFRQAPVFEEPAGPPVALPANLIEFPRQLVAARRARPRYAEGPLRDEVEAAPGDGQLRIFEVDPAQISTSPAEPEAAQWTSLWLDAPARAAGAVDEVQEDETPLPVTSVLQPATIARRVAAGAINFAVVLCGVVAFGAVAGYAAAPRSGLSELMKAGLEVRTMVTIGGVSCVFLMIVYHALFFWFSTATPGMRSVRIALCTFEDGDPTRQGVRRRMAAMLLSWCSLGMGYAWAAIDEERLTWHDRISRMYLRRY